MLPELRRYSTSLYAKVAFALRGKAILLVIGLSIRLVLAPFFMHPWDTATIMESSQQFLSGVNPFRFVVDQSVLLQERSGLPLNYYGFAWLPHVLLIFAPFYWLYTLMFGSSMPFIGGHGEVAEPVLVYPELYGFLALIKLPVILADVAIVYLLYSRGKRLALLYALNPYVIFVSAIWGMFDQIVGLFLLLSYLLFQRTKLASGFFYGLSLMKLYTLPLIGAYVFHLWRKPKEFLQFLGGAALALLPTLYWLVNDLQSFLQIIVFQGTRPVNGINMYSFAIGIRGILSQTSVTQIASVAFLTSIAIVTLVIVRRKLELFDSLLVLLLSYLIFAPVTNEQYLAALIPLAFLSTRFKQYLSVFPLLFVAFGSRFTYFAWPLSGGNLEGLMIVDAIWSKAFASVELFILYGVALGFGFLAFRTLLVHAAVRQSIAV